MLKTKNPSLRTATGGFALPTVLVASIVMLIVLLSAVSAASSVRVALDEQYYTKLAQEAAEAGQARAEACLAASNYVAQWTDSSRLRPDTTCTGSTITGGSRYIAQYGNIRTTFVVWAPVGGSASYAKVTAVGTTELIRQSSGTVHQTYSQTLVQASNFSLEPKIAGGAGWKGGGHLAVVLSTSKKLHGIGANSMGQITDTSSPASVLAPIEMALPPGVKTVSNIATSGQGGSFVCIITDTAEAWCRGVPGGGEDGLMPAAIGWHKFGLPAGLTAVSMSVSGYGPDSMCVLASDGQGYCAGENSFGSLGLNDTAYRILKIGSPERFRLDIPAPGATLRKIYTESNITCGITTDNNMYCAGINGGGAITGPVENGTGTGRYAYPIRYNIPGARKVDEVSATYHVSDGYTSVHVLGTDGTIWSSGLYQFGDFGNGTTVGSTGTSQTPSLFTHPNKAYATGSEFWNGTHSGRCIDNNGNNPANGNIIQLFDCNSSVAQTWVYGKNQQLSNLGTGKCLDVPGNSLTPGTALQLYDCNDTAAQKFSISSGSTIVHIASGLCADTTGGGAANGTLIQTWTCTAGIGPQNFTTWSGAINGWRGMITGMNHFCGLRPDSWSGMWCAGRNTHGQLANWADSSRNFMGQCVSAPGSGHSIFNVNLPGGAVVDYTKLSDEWRTQYLSTMVIATNGKVYGSGRNQFGKLGNGTLGDAANDYRECITKEFVLPAGVTAIDMSTRDEYTTYVLGSNGRIYAAGQNNLGQVGDKSTTNRLSPVEVQVPREGFVY